MHGTAVEVRDNVVNLSDGFSERVAFVAAHTAIIYDKRSQKQIFMQVMHISFRFKRTLINRNSIIF
jgi:hypothetical protein